MIAGLEILNLHAQGGMAEVYRARGKGADGRTWQYAVKRILPELTSNPDLRQMFVEEARVASLLVHPNIVRVYDLAKSELDELYIVMEFLEGRDLGEVIDRAIDLGRSIPVWLAIHVARAVLQALVYATTHARDREGRALGLIHRDISPHNMFITYDGQVKLTDFGVAKVAQSSVLTQAGVTKGKFGYMSPEQLMSEKLDFRSDLYNVGILLYEGLTCRRLFFGENASQFLQAMLKGDVPALDPALRVPPELESLMRRALARDRALRPASAADFDAELVSIAQRYQLNASHEHVAAELRAVFGDEVETCPVPVQKPPQRLASINAALPEVVARQEVPHVQIVPAQARARGLSDPSVEIRQVKADATPAFDPLGGPAAGEPRKPISDTFPRQRPPTGSSMPTGPGAQRPRTRTKSVRRLDDDPPTVPPDDPATMPPDPVDEMPRRKTVVVGGAGAKAIGLAMDADRDADDDWSSRTSDAPIVDTVSRGNSSTVITRSRRVVPIAPKRK